MEFNLAQVHDTVARAVPERECIVVRDRRLSYGEVAERTRRLANSLIDRGLGTVIERDALAGHESGQDHLAIYLHNGNEYLESMLGAFAARLVPFNVNYRYVAAELEYLLTDAAARGIVFNSAFADTLADVRDRLPDLEVLIQVDDGSGAPLLDGAEWYEDVLASASPTLAPALVGSWSGDDLYMLYTGGTTGMPKGVLWRQADIFVAALGGRRLDTGAEWESLDQIAAQASEGGTRLLPAPPFMHGAAHWVAFNAFCNANTIVIQSVTDHLDPDDVLATIERERVELLLVVGDAFGRPLVEAAENGDHDLSSLLVVVSGGAALSPLIKDRFLALAPTAMLLDGLGASETGSQASQITVAGQTASTGSFTAGPGAAVLSEDLSALLDPGHVAPGWLAQSGRVPLGYLNDPQKSTRTFPVVDGVRYSVPGDRARLDTDGTLHLLGRDSATINSGGEKIFAEEVEQALLRHTEVLDCVVAGRPSPQWGHEVVAMVQLRPGSTATDDELIDEAAGHIARYKLPKQIVRVANVQRSPAGKADYRWAAEQAVGAD